MQTKSAGVHGAWHMLQGDDKLITPNHGQEGSTSEFGKERGATERGRTIIRQGKLSLDNDKSRRCVLHSKLL